MAIKKSRRTLEYEKIMGNFFERTKEEYHEIHCEVHGLIFVRKDLEPKCVVCSPQKGDVNE